MSSYKTPWEFLEIMLEGYEPTLEDIDTFRTIFWKEGLHHDFKSGKLLEDKDRKRANRDIRGDLSAFANAVGGLLIVGIGENEGDQPGPRPIEPCPESDLDAWGREVSAQLAPYLSPPLRQIVVSASDGAIIIFAIQRAPQLVPVIEAGRIVYYFRHLDSTQQAPPYLVSDLVVGRRQHPTLSVEAQALCRPTRDDESACYLYMRITIENTSLIDTGDLRGGVLAWALYGGGVTHNLRQYIETVEPTETGLCINRFPFQLFKNATRAVTQLPPFATTTIDTQQQALPSKRAHTNVALYILPKGSPPLWYQLELLVEPPSTEIFPPKRTTLRYGSLRLLLADRK